MQLKVDGRLYPFPDFESLTFREARMMKDITGLKMGAMVEAFEQMDTDVIVALALIAISRQDGTVNADALYDLPITSVELVLPEAEKAESTDPLAKSESSGKASKTRVNETSNVG